jgi:hypothetical protein
VKPGSADLHHDEGEIVVLLRIADPFFISAEIRALISPAAR